MTNLELWRYYLDGLESPDSYIDWGFYSLISSALQRRVWYGSETFELYPNLFLVYVGPPATGKSRVINKIGDIFKSYSVLGSADSERPEADAMALRESLMFPISADSMTLEALTRDLGRCKRIHRYKVKNPVTGIEESKIYTHSSMAFILEELGSLFRKNTDDLANFLNQGYDAHDFHRITKNSGEDHIKRVCCSFLAGTTPKFLRKNMSLIVDTGLASRVIFIFENEARKLLFDFCVDQEQLDAYKHIREYVRNLHTVYGRVQFTDEAYKYIKEWWEVHSKTARLNTSDKLQDYYGRKKVHLIKLSMAIHFSEQYESMFIELPSILKAQKMLSAAEISMHKALTFAGNNPLALVSEQVLEYLKRSPDGKSYTDLLLNFHADCTTLQLKEVLEFLAVTSQIKTDNAPETGELVYKFNSLEQTLS